MSIDLSKLTPAPLVATGHVVFWGGQVIADFQRGFDAAFFALARNAFDVMMRRGWHAYFDPSVQAWFLGGHHGSLNAFSQSIGAAFVDPFTALVEADKWLTEQEKDNAL